MPRAASRDVSVTGLGAVSALGDNVAELWRAIETGRCGIAAISRFSTEAYGVHTGAEVRSARRLDDTQDLCLDFAIRAGREALEDAGIPRNGIPSRRIALVFGTGVTELRDPLHTLVESLADALDITGPRLTVSTACSSSTAAIGLGRDLLMLRAADVVLAGGADVLTREVFAGFHALGVLTPTRCSPFSTSVGTTLGEGAGFVVLEPTSRAVARGAVTRIALAGYGLSGDAWHETSPDPKGTGIQRSIASALRDADAPPATIDFVNAHGSGTEANDSAEWLGIRNAIGATADAMPVSSTKGALGHAQGAAGVLEAIVTILCMERGVIPPSLNFAAPRPHGPPDPVGQATPRPHVVRRAVSVNAAFGGANASIVMDRSATPRTPVHRRPVFLRGLGLVGPYGCGIESFGSADEAGKRRRGPVRPFDVTNYLPSVDPRGLDPSAINLTTAVALGLADAGVQIRGPLRDRTGLVVGQRRASPVSLDAFFGSIASRGLPNLSAVAFARIVLNAATGTCSKLHSLRGPLSAITSGPGSGFTALVLAAELLSTRDDVDLMVAAGVDELPAPGSRIADRADSDGAACVVISAAQTGDAGIAIAGWGISAPCDGAAAAQRALGGRNPSGIPRLCVDDWTGEGASGALLGVADAVLALRRGAIASALIVCEAGHSLSSAILLER